MHKSVSVRNGILFVAITVMHSWNNFTCWGLEYLENTETHFHWSTLINSARMARQFAAMPQSLPGAGHRGATSTSKTSQEGPNSLRNPLKTWLPTGATMQSWIYTYIYGVGRYSAPFSNLGKTFQPRVPNTISSLYMISGPHTVQAYLSHLALHFFHP